MQKYKKIIYLDQNFVSNLAKALYLSDWKDPLADLYRDLYHLLSNLTERDEIICPTSYFHREESELGYRVKEFLWHFIECLGYGLSFKHFAEILEYQITAAARDYCCLPATKGATWEFAYTRDPQVLIGQLSKPDLMVNFPNSQEYIEYSRLFRTSVADEYLNYKNYCIGNRKTFPDELETQKKQLILEIFKPRHELNTKPSKLEHSLNLMGQLGLNQFYATVNDTLHNSANPEGFFISPQLMDCPYIFVLASLQAADILFYPNHNPTRSFLTDLDMISSVIPYVDILATDNHMSELINQAKLSKRFNTQIVSSRQIKEFIAQLRTL